MNTRLATLIRRQETARSNYQCFAQSAKDHLKWAAEDRRFGAREDYMYDRDAAECMRRKALSWYAKYREVTREIVEIVEILDAQVHYVISYITPEGFIEQDRVPADRLNITLTALRELGCTHILYGREDSC